MSEPQVEHEHEAPDQRPGWQLGGTADHRRRAPAASFGQAYSTPDERRWAAVQEEDVAVGQLRRCVLA